jgi:hypothetical protein
MTAHVKTAVPPSDVKRVVGRRADHRRNETFVIECPGDFAPLLRMRSGGRESWRCGQEVG